METLNSIYSQTYNFVYLRAKSIFSKEEDAQQLMKEVYIKAMEEEVREDRLFSWFGRQIYSLGCGKFRKKKVSEANHIELEDHEYHASESVYLEKTQEVICEKIEELPDMYQATLYAFYRDHLKIKDIASMMGYNSKVILNRLNYIHKYLSKALAFYAEENDVEVEFSVEAVCGALEEWSKKNCLNVTVAQNVYGSICRELSIQSDYECEEGESAGAECCMIEPEEDVMSVLREELDSFRMKKKKDSKPKLFLPIGICVGVIVLAILLWVFPYDKLIKKEEQEKETQPSNPVTEEQIEEELEEELEEEDEIDESEYIFPNSATEKLTESDLEGMTAEQLRLARNELFARYGAIFGPKDLQEYFESKSWYVPKITLAEFNDRVEMNAVEEANLALIVKYEEKVAK